MNPRMHTEGCDVQLMWNGVYIDETAQCSHDAQDHVIDRSTHAQGALGRIASIQHSGRFADRAAWTRSR